MTDRAEYASSQPLPTELAGLRLKIFDSMGAASWAQLFFASPTQINYLLPEGMAPGIARTEVYQGGRKVSDGQLVVVGSAGGIFTANANGEGVPSANLVVVKEDMTQTITPVYALNADGTMYEERPFVVGSSLKRYYISLFGTGMRYASSITATVGGVPVDVTHPAASGEFAGLDQVNVGPLPAALAHAGVVEIILRLDDVATNPVTVEIM